MVRIGMKQFLALALTMWMALAAPALAQITPQ